MGDDETGAVRKPHRGEHARSCYDGERTCKTADSRRDQARKRHKRERVSPATGTR